MERDYAEQRAEVLRQLDGLRVEVDGRGERMNLKIRDAQRQKVPYMLVVGAPALTSDPEVQQQKETPPT